MKRWVLALLAVAGLLTSRAALTQSTNVGQTVAFTAANTTGPVINATQAAAGLNQHKFQWVVTGTVSAGGIKLQKSNDASSWSDCIAEQTVTSNGGPTTLTSCVAPYFRLFESTAITGGGTVTVRYNGYTDGGGSSVSISNTPNVTCVAGCTGGTTDTEDGNVAAGQSTGLTIPLAYMYNGSVWIRQTGDATNGLDVDVTRVSGNVAVTNADITTLAGIVTSSRAAVNIISGQTGISAGAGAVAATTPRTTLASDDPAVVSLASILTNTTSLVNNTPTIAENGSVTAGSTIQPVVGDTYVFNGTTWARLTLGRAATSASLPTTPPNDPSPAPVYLYGTNQVNAVFRDVFGKPIVARPDGLPVSMARKPGAACQDQIPFDAAISQTATARWITGRPGAVIIICGVRLAAGAAIITNEWEGTGTACGTGTIAHSGSTTAASGESFAANGGYQSAGLPYALLPGGDWCVGQSGAGTVAGKVWYVYVSASQN